MKNVILFAFLLNLPLWAQSTATSNAPAAALPAGSPAWTKLVKDLQSLQPSGDRSATTDDMQKKVTAVLNEAHDFVANNPDDPNAMKGLMLWAQLGQLMTRKNWPGAPKEEEIMQTFDHVASNPSLPKQERAQIRAVEINLAMQQIGAAPDAGAQWDAVETRFDAFEKEFGLDYSFDGHSSVLAMLRSAELEILSHSPDQARFNALIAKLAASKNEQIAALAKQAQQEQKNTAELSSKPLDLHFTAVDGSTVDLSKLRGKVVLVDFWATWCGPCCEEVPNVVATYKKYHDQGFEIVGISLDQDKDKLLSYTKEQGMVWPQYFDGKGWDNVISKGYGIDSIPAMWLIDKKGMLVTKDGREDLAGQVGKLLATP